MCIRKSKISTPYDVSCPEIPDSVQIFRELLNRSVASAESGEAYNVLALERDNDLIKTAVRSLMIESLVVHPSVSPSCRNGC